MCLQEDVEDLINDRDMALDDTVAGPAGLGAYRRAEREFYDRDQDRDDVLKRIEEKYKDYKEEEEEEMPDQFDTGVVGQQGLLPTPHDPKLWMVTVRPGAEREAAVQLMQKYSTMYNAGSPLRILSVVVLDHLKVRPVPQHSPSAGRCNRCQRHAASSPPAQHARSA